MSKFTIGIIGGGFVGQATALLEGCSLNDQISVTIYDIDQAKCKPQNLSFETFVMTSFDFVFVCVPTPMTLEGDCYVDTVKKCVNKFQSINKDSHVIIRSTVPIGFCDTLDNAFFMPEFLTEANWEHDFRNNDIIVGYPSSLSLNEQQQFQSKFSRLINAAETLQTFQKCIQVTFTTSRVAEAVKYFRNCFLALKVGFCNEMYDLCEKTNVDYQQVAEIACNDTRIGMSHSKVPGPDGQRGYGGTCFPKDMNSLFHQQLTHNVQSYIIAACLERNELKDRPQKDWCNLPQFKNRAIIDTKDK